MLVAVSAVFTLLLECVSAATADSFAVISVRWPVSNVTLPILTPIGVQTTIEASSQLPPSTMSLQYCLTSFRAVRCSKFQSATPLPSNNTVVPWHAGPFTLVVNLKLCLETDRTKCFSVHSKRVHFTAFELSRNSALNEVAAAKIQSQHGMFGPIPSVFSSSYPEEKLVLLSPNMTVSSMHQCMVRYEFVDKHSKSRLPLKDGIMCITIISGSLQESSAYSCVPTVESAPGVGSIIFVFSNENRSDRNRITRGLGYAKISFFQKERLSSYDFEALEWPKGSDPAIESEYGMFVLANSWEYEPGFNPHVLDVEQLQARAHAFTESKGPLDKKKYVYLTVVWGNAYIPGVLGLSESLRQVGSNFQLVVLLPRSNLEDPGGITPANLARLESCAGIQDVLVVDDTGKRDCLFGERLGNGRDELKRALCNEDVEHFAHLISSGLSRPALFDPRVYLKLIALGLTSYERIGVIDADAMAVGNPDDALLQPEIHFMGVGGGVVPGAFFVVAPNMNDMQSMAAILAHTGGEYRFAEMTFLNVFYGSMYHRPHANKSEISTSVFQRLPSNYLCAILEHKGTPFHDLKRACTFIDFASCLHKPWDGLTHHANATVRFEGFLCRSIAVNETGWNDGVNLWMQYYRDSRRDAMTPWENHWHDHAVAEHSNIMSIMLPQGEKKAYYKPTAGGKENVTISVEFNLPLLHIEDEVQLQIVGCLQGDLLYCFFDFASEMLRSVSKRQGALQVRFDLPFSQYPSHSDSYSFKLYCLLPGAFESGIGDIKAKMKRTLQLLSFSRYSCGTDMVEIAPVIDDDQSKTFLDAQGFVSAGGGVNPKLAKLSWDKSGISQFHTLLRAGLRRSHQFLEIGCGTLNLARYLVPFLNVGNYVCVEPNEWLVQSSLQRGEEVPGGEDLLFTMLRRKAEFIHRYDFNGSSGDRKYDFIFLHSVLSHASVSQLSQFMKVTKELLSPGGLSLASLCFCFPCEDEESRLEYEKSGRKDAAFMDQCEESYDTEWVYPYVSWWNPGRLRSLGLSSGIDVAWRNDIRKYMMSRNPLDSHDWIALRRTANRPL